jgi:flagellar biosynthetic protein FliR
MNVAEAIGEVLGRTNLSLVIFTMALLLARVLPVIILSPFLGGDAVPTEVKMGLGVLLAGVLFPAVADRMGEVPISALPYIALLLKELFIGVTLAFIASMVTDAARIAGTVVDTMSGASMAQVMVPQLQQQVSLFSSLKVQLTVVVFLTLNGHHLIVEALADSLAVVPLTEFPRFSQGSWPFFELILRTFGHMLAVGMALAAPAALAAFLTDLALGLINRVAPQVQVFFISMSIKPMVTVLISFFALHLVMGRIVDESEGMLAIFRRAIQLLG